MDAAQTYRHSRIEHWDRVAESVEGRPNFGRYYRSRLMSIYRSVIIPGQRVLEIGCAYGDLLASVSPSYGVGVDFSSRMVAVARKKYSHLTFIQADAHELEFDETFDIIILADVINDFWDVQAVFEQILPLTTPRTRIVCNYFSRVWTVPLSVARSLGLATPVLPQNWLTTLDTANLLNLAGYEIIRSWSEILWPFPPKALDILFNKVLVKLWPFSVVALTNFLTARPRAFYKEPTPGPVVSVVVPARNEAGNISEIFKRTPEMGAQTELVFVEGHSQDNTFETIEQERLRNPSRRAKLLKQTELGKGDAVRLGLAQSSGEILMVLDADISFPPEDLNRFYKALITGRGELINGVRLVYPMERRAMRLFNFLGNKSFSLAFTWLLGQSIKDTLCGTKALWRHDYERIAANRAFFGDLDPFGDFDLLFGSAKLNMKIVDMPIRYCDRVYGSTNISRWRDGWLLLKMFWIGLRKLKFI